MIAGWVIALIGIALSIYGAAIAIGFTLARKSLAVAVASDAFRRAQQSNVAQGGGDAIDWLIARIPFAFVRNMILKRVGSDRAGFAVSMLQDALNESRNAGLRTGLFGLVVCILSYWAGPWLTRTINEFFGYGTA